MPTIPLDQFEGTIPSRSGLPRTVQEAPVVPNQPGNLGASQTLGTAIEGLGTSALQAAQLAQQRAAIESKKREADDVIAGNLAHQSIVRPLQSSMAKELESGDYATLKDRVEAQGKQIIDANGQGLSVRARQIYQGKADETLSTFHLRAVNTEIQRRDEAAAFVRQQGREQAKQAMLEAPPGSYAYEVAKGQLISLTQEMVVTGMARGAPAWDDVQKTIEGVAITSAEQANRTRPQEMVTHLGALMDGKAGLPGLPNPPKEYLKALYDDAQVELQQAQATEYRGDIQAEKDVKQAQENLEVELLGELQTLNSSGTATPAAVQAVERKILTAGRSTAPGAPGMISQGGHTQLLGMVRSMYTAMASPREQKDNEEVKRALMLGTTAPGVLYPWPTREDLQAGEPYLTVGTMGEILRLRESQIEASHPSKIDEVTRARSRMRESILGVIGSGDAVFQFEKGSIVAFQMQKYQEADALFDTLMGTIQGQATTPQDKIRLARGFAQPLQQKLIENYTTYIRAYERKELKPLQGGLEAVFEKEGVDGAIKALEARKEEFGPIDYGIQTRNIRRREAIGWKDGPRNPQPAVDPKPETERWFFMEWMEGIKGAFRSGSSAGKPAVAPAAQ